MLPSPQAEPERYKGRPLLMVLENYILAAIGELPAERYEGVGQIVRKVFGGGSDWMLTVRQQLHLGDSLDDGLRQMWEKNKSIALQNQSDLHPVQFAKMVADQNFAQMIDTLPR